MAVEHEVAALLDRGPFGGGADSDAGRLGVARDGGGRGGWRRVDALGQALQRSPEVGFQRHVGAVMAGVGGAERPAGPAVQAQHRGGMVGEPPVDRKRGLALLCGQHLGQPGPVSAVALRAGRALLQEQHVHHDVRARSGAHAALRQAERAHQVGHGRDVRTGRLVSLVHGEAGCHERGQAARPQALNAPGDEVVVQAEPELACGVAVAHRAVGERRVADRQLERLGDARLGEVLAPDPGVGMQQRGDLRRARVHLDRGER